MALLDISLSDLSLAEAIQTIKPLSLFVLGMVAYAFFIFKFYRFLAHKDIFHLNLHQYNRVKHPGVKRAVSIVIYFFKYVGLMPLCIFFWFSVLTALLSLLAKNQAIENILLVSISIVGAVRITCYFSEDLAKDLAKMLPFALLGVFLVDITYFSFNDTLQLITQALDHQLTLAYYFIFISLTEFVMRIGDIIYMHFFPPQNEIQ